MTATLAPGSPPSSGQGSVGSSVSEVSCGIAGSELSDEVDVSVFWVSVIDCVVFFVVFVQDLIEQVVVDYY